MSRSTKRLLITGTTGYLGRHLVHRLGGDRIEYSSLCRSRPGKFQRNKYYIGDISSYEVVREAVRDHDLVVHLACLPLPACKKNPELSFVTNVQGTENVARACSELGKEMLFVSSSEVYGPSKILPLREDSSKQPSSIYGGHKLLAETACTAWARVAGLKYSIFRFFNIYGPAADGSQRNTVETIFLRKALGRETLIVTGGENNSRDFLFIDDAIDALIRGPH